MKTAKKTKTRREEPVGSTDRTGTHPKPSIPRVLVVDDVRDNLDLYAEYLAFKGWAVSTAENGHDALELAKKTKLDVIVMDLALPLVDGWEVTRLLKADARTRSVPIVALTGHAEIAHRRRALDAGCDLYVTKPYLPQDLEQALRELLARNKKR